MRRGTGRPIPSHALLIIPASPPPSKFREFKEFATVTGPYPWTV